MDPQWLAWAKRLQAIAQNGLTFNQNPYDIERYEQVRQIAAEIMAGGETARVGELARLFASQEGYATPKVDVRGIVFREGRLLLVREMLDGCWSPPGGWADRSCRGWTTARSPCTWATAAAPRGASATASALMSTRCAPRPRSITCKGL